MREQRWSTGYSKSCFLCVSSKIHIPQGHGLCIKSTVSPSKCVKNYISFVPCAHWWLVVNSTAAVSPLPFARSVSTPLTHTHSGNLEACCQPTHSVFLAGPSSRWDMVTGVSLFHVLMLLVRPTLWTNEKVTYVQCSVFKPSSALLYNSFIYCSNSLHNFCSSKYSGEKVTQEKSIKLYCKARSLFPLCNHTHKYCQLIMI